MGTSKLQELTRYELERKFPLYSFIENFRPEWLMNDRGDRLELDFFCDELSIAIEVQGGQHYTFVKFFHQDSDGWDRRLRYDNIKRETCARIGVKLIEVSSEFELYEAIERIVSSIGFDVDKKRIEETNNLNRQYANLKKNLTNQVSAITVTYMTT